MGGGDDLDGVVFDKVTARVLLQRELLCARHFLGDVGGVALAARDRFATGTHKCDARRAVAAAQLDESGDLCADGARLGERDAADAAHDGTLAGGLRSADDNVRQYAEQLLVDAGVCLLE